MPAPERSVAQAGHTNARAAWPLSASQRATDRRPSSSTNNLKARRSVRSEHCGHYAGSRRRATCRPGAPHVPRAMQPFPRCHSLARRPRKTHPSDQALCARLLHRPARPSLCNCAESLRVPALALALAVAPALCARSCPLPHPCLPILVVP